MPIAKIQLPDGRIARFEVPQGSTEQDVMSYVESNPNLFAQQEPKFAQQEPKKESFADKTGRIIETGLGNLGVGFTQLATSVGEKAASNIEKKIYGDNLQKETFGDRLAQQATKRKEKQAKLPFGQRLAIGAVETAPLAPLGAGMGLMSGAAVVGGVSSLLGMKESPELGNRVKEAGVDAAIGAIAAPVVNYGLGKTVGGTSAIASKIKNLFTKKTLDDKVSSIINKNIPEKDIQAGITQLEKGTNNLVGLDIESPAFENMYKTALNKFPDSKQIANEFARGRLDKAYQRINKSLDKVSLSKSGRKNIVNLKNERDSLVKPLYDVVRENPVAIPQFTYKTIKTTELPTTTKFTNQTKISGVRKDMQSDLESTEQYIKGDKATSSYNDEKGTITEGNKFLQSQKEVGSFVSGTTKGDTITKTQSKIIREGDKIIKEDREITNFENLSTKEKEIAQEFQEIKDNPMYNKLLGESQAKFSLTDGVNDSKDLMILKEKYNATNYDTFSTTERELGDILKAKVDSLLKKLSPEAKQADEIYSKFSNIMKAGNEGLKFNSVPKADVDKYVKSLNPKQLEAYRASAKEVLLEEVEKNIKTAGKTKPAEAIFNTDYDKAKIKTLFRGNSKEYNVFKKEIIDEINYNKTLERYGLTNAQVVNDENAIANIAGRALAFASGGGKTGALFETGRFIERAALKRYKGLNKKTANLLVKSMTNKENSLKALKNAYSKINDKEQKELAKQFIQDISPAITATIID